MSDNSTRNKRIARNTVFLYIRMFFVLIITLYTSRVILKTLGIEDFGIYNVVSGFVSMFGFLNATLSASIQRFYNFEFGQHGEIGIRKVYSSGFWIHVLIAVVLFVILESIGIWYINNVMVIPYERLFAANVVYQAVVMSMVLLILQIPYLGIILAYERMDFYAIVSILDVIFKLVIVLVLPFLPYDKLISYSVLLSLISIVDFLLYFIYVKRRVINLKVGSVNNAEAKQLLSFSGWNLIGTFAFVIKDQGLNMLLNVFFGPLINAARGVAFQVKSAVGSFSQSITTAFRPQIVDAYAKDDNKRVNTLFFFESKICFCLVLFLLIPLVMEIDLILRLWLGDTVPQYSGLFIILVLVDNLICSVNPSFGHVAHAVGNIKRYQLSNSIVNILIIPVAWLFLKFGFSAVSVFIVTIAFSIVNQIVCLLELHRMHEFDLQQYINRIIYPCVSVAMISFIPQVAIKLVMNDCLWSFLLVLVVDVVVTGGLVYYIILTKNERSYVEKILISKIRKQNA